MRSTRTGVLLALGFAALAPLAGCAASESSPSTASPTTIVYEADYPEFGSLEEAVAAADLIITGSVIEQKTVEVYPETSTDDDPLTNPQAGVPAEEVAKIPPVITTELSIRVDTVIQGSVAVGDVIKVSQLGGRLGGVTYTEKNTTALKTDRTYALFLAAHGDGIPYDLINPAQGIYSVSGSTLTPANPQGFKDVTLATITQAQR